MLYSQFYFRDKGKIPIPLAAVLLFVVALLMGSVFLKTGPASLRASKKNAKRIEVTNLSPVQASVFWQSEQIEEGFLFYGSSLNAVNTLALDDRDVASKKSRYLNHYVTLRNLEAGQTYFFKLVSGRGVIVKPDGVPFSFKTPRTMGAPSSLSPAHGTVLKESLAGEENALVLLAVDNFYSMSTLTKSSGEWLIPLNSFFETQSLENKIPANTAAVKIEILSEDNKNSVLTGQINQLSPVASTIIIGRNYDLNTGGNVLSAQNSASASSFSKTVDIIYPVEGSLIPGRTPLIKGVALPQSQVFITVNSSKTFSATLTADRDGNWSYLLPENLELGAHTITIRTKDNQGKEVTLTRNFTIVANDNAGRVLGEATNSATLTGTPTLTPTPTTSSVPTATASAAPTIPVAGVSAFLPAIFGLSFIIAGLGVLLVF